MFTFNINVAHSHNYPEIEKMSQQLDDLRREVAESTTAVQSAVTLITGLKAQLDALVANTTELEALRSGVAQLSADLSSTTDALAAAVAANTPDQPEVPADPEVPETQAPETPAEEVPSDTTADDQPAQ